MPQPSSDFDFASVLRDGDHVIWPQGTGEPCGLSSTLIAAAPGLPAFTLVVGMIASRTLAGVQAGNPDFLCLNGAGGARKGVALSKGRVIPAHISAIPGLIDTGRVPVDVALIRVRPTEDPGVLSLGVMVDFVHEMVTNARVVIAEIDERMPLTRDDALIDRSRITHFTVADGPQCQLADPTPSDVDVAVAQRVAEIIPDRATIQIGVGGLPVAVCAALKGHRDLGIHSGVIPDCAVDLIESGVVTNAYKGSDAGLTVTGGLFGTDRLNRFAHENRSIVLRRATYTHAAATLAGLHRFHTVNSAIEIDLTGQINAEIAGGRYVGAVGGQVDYVRAGRQSEGGRSIIAMASTTPDGKHSKIVAELGDRPVTTARSDVDLVVTEYGVADLWGLDLRARSKALIGIAHPDFRDRLTRSLAERPQPKTLVQGASR